MRFRVFSSNVSHFFKEVEFGKGDLVKFPKGVKCTWVVLEKIKKLYRFG